MPGKIRIVGPDELPPVRLFNTGRRASVADLFEEQAALHGADATRAGLGDQCFLGEDFIGNPDLEMERALTAEEESRLRKMGRSALEEDAEVAAGRVVMSITQMVENYIYIDTQPFRFRATFENPTTGAAEIHDREYLKPLYDLCIQHPKGCRNQIWHTGRQVEKCVQVDQKILMADGSWRSAGEVTAGDKVVAFDEATFQTRVQRVIWVSDRLRKPIIRIKTRLGHDLLLGAEHPVFCDGKWVRAQDLQPGSRVAAVRDTHAPEGGIPVPPQIESTAIILGWMLSEGSFTETKANSFTNFDRDALDDFMAHFPVASGTSQALHLVDTVKTQINLRIEGQLWLLQYMPRCSSFDKVVPPWVFRQTRRVQAMFLSRLWGGDGHMSTQTESKYEISYCSVSRELCRGVQALLWGFGIPTSLRSFTPTLYQGTDKRAWTVRVETQDGVNRFLEQISVFKKGMDLRPIAAKSNNNRDTLPQSAVQADLDKAYSRVLALPSGEGRKRQSLHHLGLRRKLKYPPTYGKLAEYKEGLESLDCDTEGLDRWFSRDIQWDQVEQVERLDEDACVDFTVDQDHSFIVEGLVTHNSTTQSAKAISLGVMFPAYKSLYIAPRFDQVSVFSNQRFKPMAEDSPAMKDGVIRPSKHLWQVGQKEFLNRSFFNFRSCYATADGSRGISAHHLMIDELQDIISDNIPVLEECQSHYGWETGLRFRSYAGTPKTNNNPLSRRYRKSAQFEWMTPCKHCNHWNFPDEKIIGLTCYICTRCGKDIHPQRDGQWIAMNPSALDDCWGFRLPQMVVPFKTHADIKEKMDDPNISQLKFFNECLGLPYDEGEIVLTERHIQQACEGEPRMLTPGRMLSMASLGTPLFAGLDHGTGEGDNPSFTVLAIGSFDQNYVFHIHYLKKFIGKEVALAPQPGLINEICVDAGVRWMMADWGFGAHQNARLVDEYGWDWLEGIRVLLQCQYVKQRLKAKFDGQGFKYLVDRNQSMQDCIDAIRHGKIKFPRWEDTKPFAQDFTTIYVEYNDTYGTYKYDHVDPDDAFHAVNYAYMAGLQFFGRLIPAANDLGGVDPEDMGY